MQHQQQESVELLGVSRETYSTSSMPHCSAISSVREDLWEEGDKRARIDLYKEFFPVRQPKNPIATTTIRVFIVDTVQGPKERPHIQGKFQCVDLDDPTRIQFDALSYSWGDAKDKTSILCNGVEVEVTLSCTSAIYHLDRLQHRRGLQPLTIWIDAICINQEDEHEKLVLQLPLMGRIYANARETYFWLGEGNSATDRAMAYLGNGCLVSPDAGNLKTGLALAWRITTWHWKWIDSGLAEVVTRDWINRVWTLQECLLSRNGTIVCGDEAISWFQFVLSVQFYSTVRARALPVYPPGQWHRWANLVTFWLEKAEPNTLGILSGERRGEKLGKHLEQHRIRVEEAWNISQKVTLCLSILLLTVAMPPFPIFIWQFSMMIKIVVSTGQFEWERLLALILGPIPALVACAYSHGVTCTWKRPSVAVVADDSIWYEVKRRKCTQPQDKYFGVAALINGQPYLEANGEEVPVQPELLDDSNRPSRIETHLSAEMLLGTTSLDMLLVGEYQRSNCPSWVIKWESPERKAGPTSWVVDTPGKWLGFRYYPLQAGLLGLTQFCEVVRFRGPTLDSTHTWDQERIDKLRNVHIDARSGKEKRELVVTGRIIAEVIRVRNTSSTPGITKTANVEVFRDLMEGLDPDEIDTCVKYMMLLLGWGKEVEGEDCEPLKGQVQWREIIQQREENVDKVFQQLRRAGKAVRHIHEEMSEWVSDEGVALVQCSGSAYMGFGITPPENGSKEGDCVALIAGLSLPVILRRNDSEDGKFTVVGPAFFGGLMNGRLWESFSKDDLRDISLC